MLSFFLLLLLYEFFVYHFISKLVLHVILITFYDFFKISTIFMINNEDQY